ncbi:MAG: NIPSNAP family protein [Planctomycetia bacterium]|nr:NIPSNAP family protein [Planctomycetia bacterium]
MKLNQVSTWGIALSVLLAIVAFRSNPTVGEDKKAATAGIYELRTYTTHEGRLPNLHARFKNHTMKLFEKHGMKNVMYWTPTDEKLVSNTLVYILWHASPDAAKKSWDAFRADPDWHRVRDESEKDRKIVSKVDAVYMTLAEFSPKN